MSAPPSSEAPAAAAALPAEAAPVAVAPLAASASASASADAGADGSTVPVDSVLASAPDDTAGVAGAVGTSAATAEGVDASKIGRGRNRGGNRRGGRGQNQGHQGSRATPAFAAGRKTLAVASASPVKQVAGSIAHTTREAELPPVLSAVGPASVNQAVKAVAIARSYLVDDGVDLVVEVQRGEAGGDIKDLIFLNLKKVAVSPQPDEAAFQNLKSAGRSGTTLLAGAVAKNVRESKPVMITAVGQNPVFRGVDAICFARRYLADDGYDLDFQPAFTHITFANGTEANAIQLVVLPRKANAQ